MEIKKRRYKIDPRNVPIEIIDYDGTPNPRNPFDRLSPGSGDAFLKFEFFMLTCHFFIITPVPRILAFILTIYI